MGLMPHLLPRSPLPKLKGTDIIMQLFTSQHFVYLNLPINSKPMYYLLLLWKWFCSFSLIPLYICSFQATKLISELLLPKQYVQCNGSTENLIRPFWNGSDLWYINKYNIEPPFQPLRILLSHSGMATIYEIPINVVLNIWTTLRLGHMGNALFFYLILCMCWQGVAYLNSMVQILLFNYSQVIIMLTAYLNLVIIWEPMCYLLLLWKQICSFTFLQFPHTSAHLWFSGIVYSTYRLISRIRASRNLNQHILL